MQITKKKEKIKIQWFAGQFFRSYLYVISINCYREETEKIDKIKQAKSTIIIGPGSLNPANTNNVV